MINRTSQGFDAWIGPDAEPTFLGTFPTQAAAEAAYAEADAWATGMCGHYQRSCEDGSLVEWEREVGDGFGDLAHVW